MAAGGQGGGRGRRDLNDVTLRAGTNGCLALSGTLEGPYTGDTIEFVRGASTPMTLQVDHVVALSYAWQKGAQQLTGASVLTVPTGRVGGGSTSWR